MEAEYDTKSQASRRLLAGQALLALTGAAFGALLSGLLGDDVDRAPTWLLLVALIMAGAAASLGVLRLSEIISKLERTRSESSLTFLEIDELSRFAAHELADSRIIRVIGTARDDVLVHDRGARDYLRETERRIRSGPITYRRITHQNTSEAFGSHLDTLAELARSRHRDVLTQTVGDLSLALSYQVFDRRRALVIVDAPRVPGSRDNAIAATTTNQRFIDSLILHFDHAWERLSARRDMNPGADGAAYR